MTVDHEVIIIGAGISGVGAAIRLREAGVTDVVVLERAHTFGGTWRANTYPGCACDVPSGLYSYSFAPNPRWRRLFAGQAEILAYVEDLADQHGLRGITRFGVDVEAAEFDAADRRWVIRTSAGTLTARHLVSAAGPWNEPRIPDIDGLDTFTGEVFHSARWNHDVDLRGRRVAVVGSGASAVQFVPAILDEVAALHLFQRTAQWVLPKLDAPVPGVAQTLMARLPVLHELLRAVQYGALETLGVGFRRPAPLMHAVQAVGAAYLRAVVRDRALRDALTPDYTIGCKRILFSNTYLQALTRAHAHVHPTGVARIDGPTVTGTDGVSIEADVLILGTGFHILDMPMTDVIKGADGASLAEVWQGSPEAHLGTVVTGFPQLYVMLGPSLGTGHSSAFAILEAQIDLMVDAVTHAIAHDVVLEVRPEVQAAYVAEVQAALPGTVYNAGGCQSYYLDENGRNSFSWPWSTGRLRERVSTFDPAEFAATPVGARLGVGS